MWTISRETWWSWGKTIALALLIALLVRSVARSGSGPKTGIDALNFDLPEAGTGAHLSLAQLRGTPVLIEAMTSWCGVCQRSAGALRDAAGATRTKPVRFVSVVLDSNPRAAEQLKEAWGIEHDLLVDDGSFARSYNISMLPTFVLIDAAGKVREVESGLADRDDIEGWIRSLD
jgi:thiol-disulfide isomerase/thioredoxin